MVKKLSTFIWSLAVITWCNASFNFYQYLPYFKVFYYSTAFTAEHAQQTCTCSKLIVETLEKRCEICLELTVKTAERCH